MINYKPEHMRLRYFYIILLEIWTLDFITTIIALNFSHHNLVEGNPFQAQFFALGWYGWFISFFLTASILFLFTLFVGWCGRPIIKAEEKYNKPGYYNIYLMYVCGIFSGLEIGVIINNIALLLGF